MYRALYRKWRPQRFADVVGQQGIVTALKNQVASGHVGHAYLFTGVRGTGKTTCAKIFAKAVNCQQPQQGDPCCECPACQGIDNGSILDVVEMDAASNNRVDDIRDLRDETAYTPSMCRYKVYIIDEVHMLSTQAFNALLKTLEEPPSHVIFILATTEIHKVPATILSRCQRYDFTRILPQDIAARVAYIAEQEKIELTEGAAQLIARLADGALRDALSILDTCAGVTAKVDEDVVRRMAGVTDKSYLFRISECIAAGDVTQALAEIAALRQRSVDVKRLCEELIEHYRNLMLASLDGGRSLLSGASPQEEEQYLQQAKTVSRAQAMRAIAALGDALERMGRATDQRIELELALFTLTQAPAVPTTTAPAAAPQPFAAAAPQPFMAAPAAALPAKPAPAAPAPQPAPKPEATTPVQSEADALPTLPWEQPLAATTQPEIAPAEEKQEPRRARTPQPPKTPPQLFEPWPQVVQELEQRDPMLYPFLQSTKAWYDGRRVLIECSELCRDFLRKNETSKAVIKKVIEEQTGIRCGVGPYQPEKGEAAAPVKKVDEVLDELKVRGVSVLIDEKS